jgi:hypothetical protein
MRRRYLDAMALVRRFGKPDIFLTMTCNPKWDEITYELYYRQNLVGSLPRGMPKVVDCRQTGVQATNEMVIQNNTWVYPGSGHRVGVIPYILLCFVIVVSNNVLQARLP